MAAAKKKNWVKKVVKNMDKGGLHRSLGVPAGEKIPVSKIKAAAKSGSPKVKKQANLALTFRKMKK